MRQNTTWLLVVTLIALSSLAPIRAQPVNGISDEAATYLKNALDEMQRLSVKRGEVDWPSIRSQVAARAGDAQTPEDTHDALRLAIELIDDGHSYLYVPAKGGEPADWGSEWVIASKSDQLMSKLIGEEIGYILVPSFGGEASWQPAEANAFAERIQKAIRSVDSEAVKGWVVDLRFNSGGNMWPMLAGLAPVVGEGTVGFFVGPGGSKVPWICAWGEAGTPNGKSAQVAEPYNLTDRNAWVAVLTGKYCLSSGEAIVTAFRGRRNTHSFGMPTGGASTATQPIWLGDGAMVFLTTAIYADRDGVLLGGPIPPDVVIEGGPKTASERESMEQDPVLEEAVRWIRQSISGK